MTATTDAHDPGPSIDVVAQLAAIDAALGSVTPDLVPECVAGHQVAAVVRLLGRIERRAAGARLVLSKAAADGGAWKARGFRSPEEWLAREAGTTTGEARSTLKASDQLAALPAAREAAVSGDVSAEATKAVAEGATADPSVESDLVAKARTGDLADVRDKARQARTRADERDGKARTRMFGRRSLRAWVELDGEGHGHWNVPPEFHARFLAALEPYRAEAFRLAREAGHRERPEALMADALDMLSRDVLADLALDDPTATEPTVPEPAPAATPGPVADDDDDGDPFPAAATDSPPAPAGPGDLFHTETDWPTPTTAATPDVGPDPGDADGAAPRRPTPRPQPGGNRRAPNQVIVHIDFDALMRGHAVDGETCEIPGLGPVPVSVARAMADNSLLRLVLTSDTHDVTVITSHRRYFPAPLRAAVEARDRECIVPGCHARHHLEIDHIHPFGQDGATELANIARLCRYHHALKTNCGWVLAGGPGRWTFEPP